METTLYLDTARMGALSPRAHDASAAFLSLAAAEGCSPRFESFLRHGLDAWASPMRERYQALADWRGFGAFKERLHALVQSPGPLEVLLTNRTSHLMRLAARVLFRCCRRVLVTDLEWPAYRVILEQERHRTGRALIQIPLRASMLVDRRSKDEVVRAIAACYSAQKCDGLFVSDITYEGLRLPVREIARILADAPAPPFVVVDGAQALGHVPTDLALGFCDFYFAGSHKWLQTAAPMGLGFCGRWGSQGIIRSACREMIDAGELDDPLLRFTWEAETGVQEAFGETVSLASLFPCAAAVRAALGEKGGAGGRFERLVGCARELETAAAGTGWQPVTPDDAFRSGILLLRGGSANVQAVSRDDLRRRFQSEGIALTAYGNGLIRVSAPSQSMGLEDIGQLRSALLDCA